jgi:hypothetical protein
MRPETRARELRPAADRRAAVEIGGELLHLAARQLSLAAGLLRLLQGALKSFDINHLTLPAVFFALPDS